MPVGSIIGGVGSLVGGILGSNSASNAAKQIQQGYNKASNYEMGQNTQAINQQQATTQGITNQLNPFVQPGQQSANSLAQLLQPGGQLTQGYGGFTAPTAEQAAQQPGYQFQLQQGINALQNSAAARGGLLSTGTAKNLNDYAQGVASMNYNDVYNQALGTYQTNQQNFNQNNNNLYNRLSGVEGLGLSAAGTQGGLQQAGSNALNQLYFGGGQEIGQNDIGAAQAQAAGTVGSTNAFTGGLQSGLGAVAQGAGQLGQAGSFLNQSGNSFLNKLGQIL